jgi:hypothetical protein
LVREISLSNLDTYRADETGRDQPFIPQLDLSGRKNGQTAMVVVIDKVKQNGILSERGSLTLHTDSTYAITVDREWSRLGGGAINTACILEIEQSSNRGRL